MIEKEFGDAAKRMSPIRQLNLQNELKYQQKIRGTEQFRSDLFFSPNRRYGKSKMDIALRSMYSSVSKVQLDGMNSSMRDKINFIASPHGITQVYKGHDKSEISDRNLKHLPAINMAN